MTHHYARLIAVAIAAVSFSPPITAQQEPTPFPTWETLLERVGGFTGTHERSVWLPDGTDTDLALLAPFTEWGALEELNLSDSEVTDVGLAHLTGLPALKNLGLGGTQVTAAGRVHLQQIPASRRLAVSGSQTKSPRFTDADIANLQEALPNVRISDGAPIAPPPPPQ